MKKRFVLCAVFLILSAAIVACSFPATIYSYCTEKQKHLLDSYGDELPEMLIYNSNYGYSARYQVDDETMIRSAVKAIEKIQIDGEYDICATDADAAFVFVMKNGDTCGFSFNDKHFTQHEGKNIYLISGDDALWNIAMQIKEKYHDELQDEKNAAK